MGITVYNQNVPLQTKPNQTKEHIVHYSVQFELINNCLWLRVKKKYVAYTKTTTSIRMEIELVMTALIWLITKMDIQTVTL